MSGGIDPFAREKRQFLEKLTNGKDASDEEITNMIEALLKQGLIDPDSDLFKAYEAYMEKRDDYNALLNQQLETIEKIKAVYAGITYDGLLDSIVNAFKDGNYAVEDFANNFTEIMKNAMMNMFREDIAEGYRQWYDEFAKVMEAKRKGEDMGEFEGWTDLQIAEYFKNKYIELGQASQEIFDDMTSALGDAWFADTRSAQAQGYAQASQDSINELNGRFAAIQLHTFLMSENIKIMLENMINQLAYLREIAANTYRLHQMANDMLAVKNTLNNMDNMGIKLIA